ncbi:MAG: BlaI/MecI/CopY family transcriptional regulator, partial [Bacteroidales bacterium]|nr:BlaI/MecI/CopY family transcriptional regulator [Bacteroidales bacterium]
PVITKDDYKKAQMSSFVKDYVSNSYQNMVSFFAREKNISVREMEGIMELMRKDTNGKQILK